MPKTALNTSHALYANLLFASGFDEASGDVKDLVSNTAIGTIGAGTTSSTDGTYGATIVSDGGASCGITYGDMTTFDGRTALSVFIFQKSDIDWRQPNHNLY